MRFTDLTIITLILASTTSGIFLLDAICATLLGLSNCVIF